MTKNDSIPVSEFKTIDSIVYNILTKITKEDLDYFAALTIDEARGLHHSFGMWIRNTYYLWHTHPLTERWRTDESSRDIRENVDYSLDHPDSVSNQIICALWHKVQSNTNPNP